MRRSALLLCSLLAVATPASAQGFDEVEIHAQKLADGVYMMTGRGGNLGLSVGEDGVFLIDDQFAPLTDKILSLIHI